MEGATDLWTAYKTTVKNIDGGKVMSSNKIDCPYLQFLSDAAVKGMAFAIKTGISDEADSV